MCEFCLKYFSTQKGYWNHTVKLHIEALSSLPKKEFPCKECIRSFASKQCLEKHMRRDHKTSVKLEVFKELQMQNKTLIKVMEKLMKENPATLQTELTVSTQKEKAKNSFGYVYLLQLREFVKTNEDVYKVGMTSQENHGRLRGYPKGSVLLFQDSCENYKKAETQILDKFKETFTQMKDIGAEYFKGDLHQMKDIMHTIVNSIR